MKQKFYLKIAKDKLHLTAPAIEAEQVEVEEVPEDVRPH